MTDLQHYAADQYQASIHINKRLRPENYEMFKIPEKLLKLSIAEKLLMDAGIFDIYKETLQYINDIHESQQGLKQ